MTPGEWTPARLDLLRAEYASAEANAALLAVWVALRLAGDVLAWWARDEDGGWHE